MRVDLNADVGESFGSYVIGQDPGLFQSITSASVAAGVHGGDPSILRATLRRAKAANVAVGAHPGFPDLAGFGRRRMFLSPSEAEDLVLYQVAAVAGVAAAEGIRLQHVKPHGALYTMAAADRALASAIARATAAVDRSLLMFGPPGSALLLAAEESGLATVAEVFADRAYQADGALVPRRVPGAVLHEAPVIAQRAIRIVQQGVVTALDGTPVRLVAETLCVHSDTPGSAAIAAALRSALEEAAIAVRAIRPPAP